MFKHDLYILNESFHIYIYIYILLIPLPFNYDTKKYYVLCQSFAVTVSLVQSWRQFHAAVFYAVIEWRHKGQQWSESEWVCKKHTVWSAVVLVQAERAASVVVDLCEHH